MRNILIKSLNQEIIKILKSDVQLIRHQGHTFNSSPSLDSFSPPIPCIDVSISGTAPKFNHYQLKVFTYYIYETEYISDNSIFSEIIQKLALSLIKDTEISSDNTNKLVISDIIIYNDNASLRTAIELVGLLIINKETLQTLCKQCNNCPKKISCLLKKEDCWLSKLYQKYEVLNNR